MSFDWLNTLYILGTLASIVGLLLALLAARRVERRKLLTYEVTPSLPLANVLPDRTEHRLSIVYEREGDEPINVKGAYLRFVRIGNLGKEPVRKEDIAPSDPLMLKVARAKVLDIAISSVSRDVIKFTVNPFEEAEDKITSSLISFDFLDYQDGATIRVLTDRRRASIGITGTIIGMPEGILIKGEIEKHPILNKVGCGLAIILQLIGVVAAVYAFRIFTGGWVMLWPYLIPLAVLLAPLLVIAIASNMWPKGSQWKTLGLPHWFRTPDIEHPEYRFYYDHDYDLEEEPLTLTQRMEELEKRQLASLSDKDDA